VSVSVRMGTTISGRWGPPERLLGALPAPPGQRFEYPVTSKGRLSKVEEFEKIVVRRNDGGSIVYLSHRSV
jgi:multidrug efflux pump subunit AcrB